MFLPQITNEEGASPLKKHLVATLRRLPQSLVRSMTLALDLNDRKAYQIKLEKRL